MDNAQTLKILLQVQADVADLQGKLNPALTETKTRLAEAGEASGNLSAGLAGAIGGATVAGIAALTSAIAAIPSLIEHAWDDVKKSTEEIYRQTSAIDREVDQWIRLAKAADDFGDVVNLGDKIAPGLASAAAQMQQFLATTLVWWKRWADTIAAQWSAIPGFGSRPFAEALASSQQDAARNLATAINAGNITLDTAAKGAADWAETRALPIAQGIEVVTARIKDLNAQAAQLKTQSVTDKSSPQELELAKATLDKRIDINDKLAVEKGHLATLKSEQDKITTSTEETGDAHQDILSFLGEESALLRGIRQINELNQQNPLLFADQKEASDLQSTPQQIAAINAKIQEGKAYLAHSALDPTTYRQASAGIQNLQFQAASLGQKFVAQTNPIRTGLVAWVNQFGSTMHQVSNLITGTLTIAVNGVSNAITAAIFKTQSWGQSFAQIAQSIVGNIIQIGLQLIESQLAAFIIRQTLGAASQETAAAEGAALAAIYAPAAVAASIATEGGAAIAGQTAFTASLLSGQAFAVALAAFAEGGAITKPTIALMGEQGPEFVFSAPAVRRIGQANLKALHENFSRPSFTAGGGLVGPSVSAGAGAGRTAESQIHIFNFTDFRALKKAYEQSSASKKFIVNTVNSAGGRLRS
jgi:hypothetical protein